MPLTDLKIGSKIEGEYDARSKEISSGSITARRNKADELRYISGCIRGTIKSKDILRSVLVLSGENGDAYEFEIRSDLKIWCHGDTSILRRFDEVPEGMHLVVRYTPSTPHDVAVEINGLHCGGK